MIKTVHKKLFKGFTLIELLIVIAILGILAAAVMVAIDPGKRTRQAQDAERKNEVGTLATELQGFYTAPGSGCYPSTLSVLVNEGYLKQMPRDPVTNADYTYATSGWGSCNPIDGPTEVSVSAGLSEPSLGATGTTDWCWQSITGTASEDTSGLCAAL